MARKSRKKKYSDEAEIRVKIVELDEKEIILEAQETENVGR